MRFFVAMLIFGALPFVSEAQIIPDFGPTIELIITPFAPTPGSTVAAEVVNVFGDGAATFVWEINGSIFDSGPNIRRITFRAPALGESVTVSVRVTSEGKTETVSRTITPGDVDLVWEGRTERPPFYSGRPLPNRESAVVLSAYPHLREGGVRLEADSLVYEWYVNNSPVRAQRGIGLSSLTIEEPPRFGEPFDVRVHVTNPQGNARAVAQITIEPEEPTVLLYENAPLLGFRFDRAIRDEFILTDEALTLHAWPLFTQTAVDHLYTWRLNGRSVDTGATPRTLTLLRPEEGGGRERLQVELEGPQMLFEKASRSLRISF
jgi:hypothetical protein